MEPTQISAPNVPGAGSNVKARGSAATTDNAPASWARADTPAASPTTSPRVFGYCHSTPIQASPRSADVASPTTTSIPRASQRVLTTAIVCGWHCASAKNVMAPFFLPFLESATHMDMASAAAVASSRSDALAISIPVSSVTKVWYTAYTPYQAEISQGRLEMLLNYQTLVTELTGMEMANASLLDEATAAAEAMSMCVALSKNGKKKGAMTFFADAQCHPQTIAVVKTRCEALGIDVVVGDATSADLGDACIGVLWQYPNTRGDVVGDAAGVSARAHDAGALSVVAADPLALTLLPAPGTFGADICVGSMQRYGVPMGFGGPHAAYMATSEKYARRMPGRIIGETVEANERKGRALRMAT